VDVVGLPSGVGFSDSITPNGFGIAFESAVPSVPEPSAWSALAIGLACIGLVRRRPRATRRRA
jgi:hypothetical protein